MRRSPSNLALRVLGCSLLYAVIAPPVELVLFQLLVFAPLGLCCVVGMVLRSRLATTACALLGLAWYVGCIAALLGLTLTYFDWLPPAHGPAPAWLWRFGEDRVASFLLVGSWLGGVAGLKWVADHCRVVRLPDEEGRL